MSRTWNTAPYKIQERRLARKKPWLLRWYPVGGGSWSGIKQYTKQYWRALRRRVRQELQQGEEPIPEQHKNSEKWIFW